MAQQSALAHPKETNICFIDKHFFTAMSNYLRSEKILNLISMETLQLKLFRFNLHRRNDYWCRKLLLEGHGHMNVLCQTKFLAEEMWPEYVSHWFKQITKNINNAKYKNAPHHLPVQLRLHGHTLQLLIRLQLFCYRIQGLSGQLGRKNPE